MPCMSLGIVMMTVLIIINSHYCHPSTYQVPDTSHVILFDPQPHSDEIAKPFLTDQKTEVRGSYSQCMAELQFELRIMFPNFFIYPPNLNTYIKKSLILHVKLPGYLPFLLFQQWCFIMVIIKMSVMHFMVLLVTFIHLLPSESEEQFHWPNKREVAWYDCR